MSPALAPLLAKPDAALLAVITGILLLYAEFNVPGTVLPGCLGALSLMLGLFALSLVPLRPAALGLALAGLALLLLALVSTRFWLSAAVGWILLTLSFLHLIDTSRSSLAISPPAALLAASLFSGSTVWLGRIALRARRNKQLPRRASVHSQSRLNNSDLR